MVSNVSASGPGIATVYDALGRAISVTQNGRTLSYAYDAAGNRTALAWPETTNALTANYTYDGLNNVAQIQQNGATSGAGLLAAYTYDGAGRRSAISRAGGAGLATSYAYDAISRLSTLTQTLSGSAGTTFTYGYNPASQVISRTDSNGGYSVLPSSLASAYTANGLNQYSSVTGQTLTLSSGPQASLAYDPLGRIQSETASGSTSNFLYDGAFLAEEYGPTGNTLARYVPGPGLDEPITVYGGSGLTANWYASDQEGSIIATADASANLIAAYDYGPYGEPLTSGGAPSWGGSRYRYTGQIEIPGAQAYFYKARMYDPGNGRFFQTDPAGFAGGINIYAYAVNDPINGWDSWGLGSCPDQPNYPATTQGGVTTVSELIVCVNSNYNFGVFLGGILGGNGGISGSDRGQNIQPMPSASPSQIPKYLTCVSETASNLSAAELIKKSGLVQGQVANFAVDAVAGNPYSAVIDLVQSAQSGSAGGHSFAYNGAQSAVSGPAQGFGAVANVFGKTAPSGVADTAVEVTAVQAVGAGAARAILGPVALAKLGYDTISALYASGACVFSK
jgi:RHS repeat-associated protein